MIEIPITASAKYNVSREEKKEITDHRNFLPRTNKIEEVGVLNRHKFLISCDGQGHMAFKELKNEDQRIKQLEDLERGGLITAEQRQQRILRILDGID